MDQRIRFTSLAHRPRGFAEASAVGKHIAAVGSVRSIDDGPYGGTRLPLGEGTAGEMLTTPPAGDGENWGSVPTAGLLPGPDRLRPEPDPSYGCPGAPAAHDLPTAPLGSVARLGLVHRDITGPPPRGPFDKIAPSPTATYPALWNHNSQKGNPYGLRTGLATAGTPGNGG